MKMRSNETPDNRDHFEIGVWENEGGALGRDNMDSQYGRRVEVDRSWTVYHVFTGVPAVDGDRVLTGLNRADATDGMLSLNRLNGARRRERVRNSPKLEALEIEGIQSWR